MQIIKLNQIYDSNLNFLLGSGASYGLFPTLALGIKDAGESQTVETLATRFSAENDEDRLTLLFMHYYEECIKPVQLFDPEAIAAGDLTKQQVLTNYRGVLLKLLRTVQQRQPLDKRLNLFTTNYDGCVPLVADSLLRSGSIDFQINDGGRGFRRRVLHSRNFNTFLCQTGVFDRHSSSVPQVNLVHLHGSVYWKRRGSTIEIDYGGSSDALVKLHPTTVAKLKKKVSAVLNDSTKTLADLPQLNLSATARNVFWEAYKKLPIVNPTKWKFHETVFEEHYYQALRLLSYELERPQSILITFGFSFADEHILNLVKRSLSNPALQMFVCCFNDAELTRLKVHFESFPNVIFLTADAGGVLDFKYFNEKLLVLEAEPATAGAAGAVI